MKKILVLSLVLVLTAALLAGCRSKDMPGDTAPMTSAPTVSQPTTVPTTEATVPTTEMPTDVTTTPTDGEIDPSAHAEDGDGSSNPATSDLSRARRIIGMH